MEDLEASDWLKFLIFVNCNALKRTATQKLILEPYLIINGNEEDASNVMYMDFFNEYLA